MRDYRRHAAVFRCGFRDSSRSALRSDPRNIDRPIDKEESMRVRSTNGWLPTLALVAGIAGFTTVGSVYADGNGCLPTSTQCFGGTGTCAYVNMSGGDFCACAVPSGEEEIELTPTCDCSTGEYPPCDD